MYLHGEDLETVRARLDQDDEIAWIRVVGPIEPIEEPPLPPPWTRIPRGQAQVRALRTLDGPLVEGDYVLWHTPAGKPNVIATRGRPDPWAGWLHEDVRFGPPPVPHFEAEPRALIRLEVRTTLPELPAHQPRRHLLSSASLPVSAFTWVASSGGAPPNPETTAWWHGLKRWVSKSAKKLRIDPPADLPEDVFRGGFPMSGVVYAFPSALERYHDG